MTSTSTSVNSACSQYVANLGAFTELDSEETLILYDTPWIRDSEKSIRFMFIFRAIIFVWAFAAFIVNKIIMFAPYTTESLIKSPFYLTNWGYMLVMIYFFVALLFSTQHYGWIGKVDAHSEQLCITRKRILVVLYETAFTLECCIVSAFWVGTIVFHINKDEYDTLQFISTCHTHGMTIIWLIADHLMNNMPFYSGHFVYPVAVCCLYAPWNMLYVYFSGDTIYSVFTWDNWQSYAILSGCLLLVIAFFFVGFGLARLIEYAVTRIMGDEKKDC